VEKIAQLFYNSIEMLLELKKRGAKKLKKVQFVVLLPGIPNWLRRIPQIQFGSS